MNVRSLRFKLGWNHGLIISAVLVGLGLARYQTVSYRSRLSFDQDLQKDARLAAERLQLTGGGFVWNTYGLTVSEILTVEAFRPYVVVTNAQGRIVRGELLGVYMREMAGEPALGPILTQRSGFANATAPDGTNFRFITLPLSRSDSPALLLHLGRPTSGLRSVLREYFVIYVWSLPAIVVVSIVVGWFLAGRALKPFEEVAQTAKQITSRNLSTRIAVDRNEAEIQSLVESFNAMVGRLNASFEQIRRFNADVAHEFRTPLAIMRGENEVALRSPGLSDDARAVLASNLEELERLTRIVNDLLTLSEAEAGSRVMARKPIQLKALLQDLVEQMQLLAADRDIRLELTEIPDATIEGDELWIRRALLNLLDNAIKYSRQGGCVRIDGQVRETMVQVTIRDQGIGIAAADIPYIFNRLYRADPARSRASGGTGLGLALVKWVVEAHDGHIDVKSVPDHGSSFELAFPVRAA